MAISENGTKLANLVNPEVLADMISAELPNAIALAPLATVGRKLQGRAGDTIKFPAWNYIGDANDVAEGADISITQMGTTDTSVTVKKAGKGVEITDEAVLSGYGDPVGEAKNQLKMSIANKIDNDLFEALSTATLTVSGTMSVVGLLTAKAKFGEDVDQPAVLVVSPNNYVKIASEIVSLENTDKVLINGVVGKVAGLQVKVSGKVTLVNFEFPAKHLSPKDSTLHLRLTSLKFLDARIKLSVNSLTTTNTLPSIFKVSNILMNVLVLASLTSNFSKTIIPLLAAL